MLKYEHLHEKKSFNILMIQFKTINLENPLKTVFTFQI